MEMPKVAQAQKAQVTPIAKPTGWQTTPKAREMEFTPMTDVKKPAGTSELRKKDEYTNKSKPEPTVNAPAKPFGLSDTQPKAPEPHDLTEYKDEHPMKKTSS